MAFRLKSIEDGYVVVVRVGMWFGGKPEDRIKVVMCWG